MAQQRLFNSDQNIDVPDSQNIAECKKGTTKSTNLLLNIAYKFTDTMVLVGETVSTISVLLGKKLLSETIRGISRLHTRMIPHVRSLVLILQLSLIRLCEPMLKVVRGINVIRQRSQLARIACLEEVRTDENYSESQVLVYAKKESALEALRTAGELAWESRKLITKSFSYVAPALSVAFFIGIVGYASNLEYAVNIRYNGQDLGYIEAESDCDAAEREVQQKISYVAGNETVTFTPKLSLKIIQSSANYINPSELADKFITNSENALVEAYGFYIDGEFCGAIKEKDAIEKELASMLLKYQGIDGATDVSFVKEPTFEQSIFLVDSVVELEDIISLLRSNTSQPVKHTLTEDDSLESVLERYGITKDELERLNPNLETDWTSGLEILISAPKSYMPVSYKVNTEFNSPISYNTITIEDNNRYEGYKEVTIPGKNGELMNIKENRYIDGYLNSSEIISSVIVSEAVTENIVIGTKKSSSYSENIPTYTGPIELNGDTNFIWPCNGGKITSRFGYRWGSLHGATDIAAPFGTDIYAAADGVVVLAGWHYSYGNYVVIDHGNGIATLYAHASSLLCKSGDYVSTGTVIAKIGNTGSSYGNHLHFEVRINGVRVDPELYISQP